MIVIQKISKAISNAVKNLKLNIFIDQVIMTYMVSKQKIRFFYSFSKKLCGKFRKGHFKGVLDVVNRLIEIIRPSKIFLGNKDFQQLYLVKKHIKKN